MSSRTPSGFPIRKPLLELEDVSVRRNGRALLRGISWAIREGELWAAAGPNGSGKSALLGVLTGELAVDAGSVRIAFPGPRRRRRGALDIERVSFDAQHDFLKGAGGYHQARWHGWEDGGVPTAREVLAPAGRAGLRLASLLGLGRALDRRITRLSNGERRKLLIARAAARAPALLALDNPLAGLDGRARARLLAVLRRLSRRGHRLLILAARSEDIPAAATHVLLLDRGRIAAAGPLGEVKRSAAYRKFARAGRGSGPRASVAHRRASTRPGRRPAPIIECRGVTVRYGGRVLLDRIRWTVRRGERWALLGPNGAGKSTLLSLVLADNPQAYASDLSLFGRRRGSGESIWEIKRRIGAVSPELHLFHPGSSTVLDVITSGLHDSIGRHRINTPEEDRRGRRWLVRVGLAGSGGRPFGALSEGGQRLALLARALIKRPQLLVLDEPCQGLDAAGRTRFHALLGQVARRRDLSLIYVTHERGDLPDGLDHALLLVRARVAAMGSPGPVLRKWKS